MEPHYLDDLIDTFTEPDGVRIDPAVGLLVSRYWLRSRGQGYCPVDVNVMVRRRVSTRRRVVVCGAGVECAVVYGATLWGRNTE